MGRGPQPIECNDGFQVDCEFPLFAGGFANMYGWVLFSLHSRPPLPPPQHIQFFDTVFEVHHNSNRLGIRLNGPRPKFARPDGGEGGSHPSNVHDHVYAVGTVNYTGDMPM